MTENSVNTNQTKPETAWLLHHGIKSLLRCDEAETVQSIARYVISKYRSLRVGSEFIERRRETPIPSIAAFLAAVTRFLEVRAAEHSDGAIWVARLENERKALETIPPLLPEINWTQLRFRRKPDWAAVRSLPRELFPLRRRIFRLTRLLLRRGHPFFKVMRAVELIGYYARYREIFERGNFAFALMSSHSNPHGIAFNLAARRNRVPTVLVTHGLPVRPVARLAYDLAVVHCEFARRIYAEAGCKFNQIIIHGRRQDYAPMPVGEFPERLTAGIFLCKDVNEKQLDLLVKKLLADARISQILIRPHPKNLFVEFDDWLAALKDARIRRSVGKSARIDLKESDVVFGGNSSVLVEAVTAGRPSVYVPHLDYGFPDLHEFVGRRLIYPLAENQDFDLDAMLRFYQRPEPASVLRLYANIDETETGVAELLKFALRKFVTPTYKL